MKEHTNTQVRDGKCVTYNIVLDARECAVRGEREGGDLRGVLRMNEGERGKRLERAGELPNVGKNQPSSEKTKRKISP